MNKKGIVAQYAECKRNSAWKVDWVHVTRLHLRMQMSSGYAGNGNRSRRRMGQEVYSWRDREIFAASNQRRDALASSRGY
jgi:hypothetical protein